MILVTGGAGFIGSNFIRRALSETDDIITNLDCLTYAADKNNMPKHVRHDFFKIDIRNKEGVEQFIKQQPKTIFHFAAESHVDNSISGPEVFVDTNVKGTFNLLEAVRKYSPDTLFIHISTDEVYGSLGIDDPSFTENSPYRPNSPYSASKASSDLLVRSYHETYGLKTIITNCSNNYGPYQNKEKLIPKVITNALQDLPIPIYGNGQNVRDWIHVDDHCDALLYLMRKGSIGQSYNIGAGEETTNIDLVNYICNSLNLIKPRTKKYNENITFAKDRLGHDLRYSINYTKLRELGWIPKVGFEVGLYHTIKFYTENI